jgi:BirA family biotin operon repressor/biotin-[acetyl-CoA-carboxylase] ligase
VSDLAPQVFRRLADGAFHSGESLAREFGVSRSAVWKAVHALESAGAHVEAVRNRGYRIAAALGALDAQAIRAALPVDVAARIEQVEVAWSLPSTNDVLLSGPEAASGRARVLLAEHQTAGRGRRGRAWVAPLGGALCLSLGYTFPALPRDVAALPLGVGVWVADALRRFGALAVRLKWPNDLVIHDAKLGGVLMELRAEAAGPAWVVIGLGLNVALDAAARAPLTSARLRVADLADAGVAAPTRNALASAIVAALVRGLETFAAQGAAAFLDAWRAADAMAGREVRVEGVGDAVLGIARGVDASGALRIETAHGVRTFLAGDVSLRGAA